VRGEERKRRLHVFPSEFHALMNLLVEDSSSRVKLALRMAELGVSDHRHRQAQGERARLKRNRARRGRMNSIEFVVLHSGSFCMLIGCIEGVSNEQRRGDDRGCRLNGDYRPVAWVFVILYQDIETRKHIVHVLKCVLIEPSSMRPLLGGVRRRVRRIRRGGGRLFLEQVLGNVCELVGVKALIIEGRVVMVVVMMVVVVMMLTLAPGGATL
jgi:hypothetical protein